MPTASPAPRFAALGSRIRDARARTGLSQEAFAVKINTSRRHVMRLEKGMHRPSGPMLARIAEETGVPASEITNGTDEEEESEALSPDDFAAALVDLVRLYRRAKVVTA